MIKAGKNIRCYKNKPFYNKQYNKKCKNHYFFYIKVNQLNKSVIKN